jgi:polysaccharide biosynthesis/export protein
MRPQFVLIIWFGLFMAVGCGVRTRSTMEPSGSFRRIDREHVEKQPASDKEKAVTKEEKKQAAKAASKKKRAAKKARKQQEKEAKRAEKARKKELKKALKAREKSLEKGDDYEIPAELYEPIVLDEIPEPELSHPITTSEILLDIALPPTIELEEIAPGYLPSVTFDAQPQTAVYRLQPGDRISVHFPHVPEMNFTARLRPDGVITSPQFGEFTAFGKSSSELSSELTTAYGTLLKHPEAHVSVSEFSKQYFYVFGEVDNPSRFEWEQSLDLIQALTLAGGSSADAEMANVVVVSVNPDGAYSLQEFDLTSVFLDFGSKPYWLSPRDIIIVPSTTISNVNRWVDQYINSFMNPIDSFLRSRYYWFLAKEVSTRAE